MTKIRFEDGTVVNFNGKPTPEDIDFAAKQLGVAERLQQTTTQPKQAEKQIEAPEQAEPERSFARKVGDFFTSGTQKFAETLGTAASVIDPKTKKLREETIMATDKQVDDLMTMAREAEDKERSTRLLVAAQKLADTEDIDIYNNEEYQKTAKQVLGEAGGVVLETLGWGKVGGLAKGVKTATAAKTALRSAKTGGILGVGFGASEALQEGMSGIEAVKEGLKSGAVGALTGGALGYGAGKISGKISQKQATKLVSPQLSKSERVSAAKAGRLKPRTLLRPERYTPSQRDKELAKIAQDVNLKGKNPSKDIVRASNEIEKEAVKLKSLLKKRGGVYNKNIIKGQLNKMKSDVTADLIEPEVKVYEKMIKKFNKLADNKKNKGLDGLLEVRQEFDKWAVKNSKNIFSKETGSARALRAVRDTINDYINTQVGDDVVRTSLTKQSGLFSIIDNMAENIATRGEQLQPAKISKTLKKATGWGAVAASAYLFGKKGGNPSRFVE